MKNLTVKWFTLVFALGAIMFLSACHKKTATAATATATRQPRPRPH